MINTPANASLVNVIKLISISWCVNGEINGSGPRKSDFPQILNVNVGHYFRRRSQNMSDDWL